MRVEESSQVACFILCWLFLKRGGFLHSADAKGLNDKWGTFLRIRPQFLERFTLPRGPHQARPGEPASPEGSFCTVSGGILFYSYVVIIGTPPERHTGRSLRFRW